jgi:hypothetical protein
MEKITLDRGQLAQLTGDCRQVPVYDEAGNLLGVFLPRELVASSGKKKVEVPFSDEELERFRQSGGGISLTDFWQRLGAS